MPFAIKKAGTTVGTRRALNLVEGANIGLTVADDAGNDRVNVTVALASVPAHVHAEADVTNLVTDLAGKAALSHNHDASNINAGTLALARGGAGANLSGTGPGFLKQTGVGAAVTVAALASGDLPAHTHTSAQISDATAAATASTVVLRDGSAGANFAYVAANNLWAYLDSHLQSVECGAYGSVGGAFENMAKYSEDFTVATWDKNGGSASVSRERRRRARWQHDRRPDHRQRRDADHPAADRGPGGRRASTRSTCGPRSRPERRTSRSPS